MCNCMATKRQQNKCGMLYMWWAFWQFCGMQRHEMSTKVNITKSQKIYFDHK